MTEPRLFDVSPEPEQREPESTDRRRTRRNQALLDAGTHPITRLPLAGNGQTCGTCEHRFTRFLAKRYHKCDLNPTRGAATDVRVGWPACTLWEAKS